MGHEIRHLEYAETTDRKHIVADANELATRDGDYHHALDTPIRFIEFVCEDREKAYEYIQSHDKGWYDNLAVKFKEYPRCEPTKALLTLKDRQKKEHEKRIAYEKAHSVSSFKVEYIGCPHCGSKLKRTLLRGNSCPLCGTELRSKTTMDTLNRYAENIKSLSKQILEEERKVKEFINITEKTSS